MIRPVIYSACGVISVVGATEAVLAAEPASETPDVSHLVRVYVGGSAKAVEAMRTSIRELLSRLNLQVVVQPAQDETVLARPEAGAARAFVQLEDLGSPRVVVQGAANQELERRVLPRAASLEVATQEASHVVYMAIEASLSAREEGTPGEKPSAPATPAAAPVPEPSPVQTETPPPAAPPPKTERSAEVVRPEHDVSEHRDNNLPRMEAVPAPDRTRDRPSRASRVDAELRAFGALTSFDAARAAPGIGAAVDVGIRLQEWRVSAILSGTSFFPYDVTSVGETASLRAEAFRLAAGVRWTFAPRFAGVLSVGGGMDWITLDAGPPNPSVWTAGVDRRIDPMAEGLIGLEIRLSRVLSTFAFGGTEVDLAPHRYLLEDGDATRTFLKVENVRPLAFIGLSLSFGGGATRQAKGEL